MTATDSITPDFVYILQIREYQHVLRPSDQKSARFIVLAKVVIGDIDSANNLLVERGPFLVAEKQQMMRDIIDDAEDAINRVTKLLIPARIDKISEESIRVNTKSPYTLESDNPKAAATFGRLQLANNRLSTVVHDLRNIEATAQLDTCEIRATTSVRVPPSRTGNHSVQKSTSDSLMPVLEQHETIQAQRTKEFVRSLQSLLPQDDTMATREESLQVPAETSMSAQLDPKSLIAWKRSRRGSRNTNSSIASSVSSTNPDEHDTPNPRTPLSSQDNVMPDPLDLASKTLREHHPNENGIQTTDAMLESTLPTIHELDGDSSGKVANEPDNTQVVTDDASQDLQSPHLQNCDQAPGTTLIDQERVPQHQLSGSGTRMPGAGDSALQLEQGKEPAFRRETFASYKRRNRETRQSRDDELMTSPGLSHLAHEHDRSALDTCQGSLLHQNDVPVIETNEPPKQILYRPYSRQAACVLPAVNTQTSQGHDFGGLGPSSSAEMVDYPSQGAIHHSSPPDFVTPSNMYAITQTQTPIQVGQQYMDSSPMDLQAPAHNGSINGNKVIQTEGTIGRVPTLLRVGERSAISQNKPPYPMSDAGSDYGGIDHLNEAKSLQRPKNADRSVTVPPVNGPRQVLPSFLTLKSISENPPNELEKFATAPLDSQQPLYTRPMVFTSIEQGEKTHQRSQSEAALTSRSLIRAPTIPRKPLPYQPKNLPEARADESTLGTSVSETPSVDKPKSVSDIQTFPKVSQTRTPDFYQSSFYPPSPIGSGLPQTDEKLQQAPPTNSLSSSREAHRSQYDSIEDSQPQIYSRMSSLSSTAYSFQGPDSLSERYGLPDVTRTSDGPDYIRNMNIASDSDSVADAVRLDHETKTERAQLQNPLKMHPTRPPPMTAYQAQSTITEVEEPESYVTDGPGASVSRQLGGSSVPAGTGFAYVSTPLHMLNPENVRQHAQAHQSSRSRRITDPDSPYRTDVGDFTRTPPRTTAHDSSSVNRTSDRVSGTDSPDHARTEPQLRHIFSEPDMTHGPSHPPGARLTHSISEDGQSKSTHEPTAFQAQTYMNNINSRSLQQLPVDKTHISHFSPEQRAPQMLQQHHRQFSAGSQQIWGPRVPGAAPVPLQYSQQSMQQGPAYDHQKPLPTIPFTRGGSQLSYVPQEQYHALPHHNLQHQTPPQFRNQPLQSPPPPTDPPPPIPGMQNSQRQWSVPGLSNASDQFTQPGIYQQQQQQQRQNAQRPQQQIARPPPPLESEFSLQQVSPVLSPSKAAKPPSGLPVATSPPRRTSPVQSRPMSYVSADSQEKFNSDIAPVAQINSPASFKSVIIAQPTSQIHHISQSSKTEGPILKVASSMSSTTEYTARLTQSPSVPMMGSMPGSVGAAPSLAKTKRSTWLHHQASRMQR